MTERLARWTEEQGHVLDRLARLAPKTQEVVAQTIEKLQPIILQAAERIHQRPERVVAQKQKADVYAAREELLAVRMREFERAQRAGIFYIDPAREKQWATQALAEEARQRAGIGTLSDPELRRSLQQTKAAEREREAQASAPRRSRGMGLER